MAAPTDDTGTVSSPGRAVDPTSGPAAADAAGKRADVDIQGVLEALPWAVVVLGMDGRPLADNEAGRSLIEDSPEQDADPLEALRDGVAAGEEFSVNVAQPGPEGTDQVTNWSVHPVPGRDEVTAMVAVGENAQTRSDVRQAVGLLDALFSTAPVGIAIFDEHGRFRRVNGVLSEMDGHSVADHLGHTANELLPSLDRNLDALVAQVLSTGRAVHDVELITAAADGATRTWSASLFRLHEAGGGVVGVGALLLEVSEQRTLERERANALSRLALTSRASDLLSSSLDPSVVQSHLCDLLVPALADHVYVDLREESDRLRRTAIRHVETAEVDEMLERPVGHLSSYRPDHPIRQALEHGESIVIRDLVGDAGMLPDGFATELLRSIKATTMMVVPMTVAGRRIGTVGMLCSVSGRRYDGHDRAMAQDVVSRAAMAVANALSYQQQRSAAVALQRSLLPGQLSGVEGMDVAWRYVPGSDDTMVGGDWVDVIELPGGRVGLTVGDVMGRGLRAAAVMGQLRTAVRTLAVQDLQPAEVLTRLDSIVESLPEQIVTCVYAIYDPGRGIVTWANAGHLPPVLLNAGSPRVLSEASAVPLGVGGVSFTEAEADMPLGGVLALYTDGLVERPGTDLDASISDLAATLGHGDGSLERRCSAVLARSPALTGRGFDDDVALLLVRADADPMASSVRHRLPPRPESVRQSRRLLEAAMAEWKLDGFEDLATTAELLMSEVVTNAVRVSDADLEVLVRRGDHAVWIEIADDDTRQPRLRHAAVDDEGGRGLAMVQALSAAWGTRPTPDGKTVWFRLDR